MKPELNHLLEEYAGLEQAVQKLVRAQCGSVCGLCTVACCCRADICEEALDSPFLRFLHGRDELESDAYGFLTENGCALETGRPPICYEFFCEAVLDTQPDDLHRDLLKILGRLPTHAGQHAHGETHLVEIMNEEELDHLAFQTLEKQMQECFQCLEVIRSFYDTGDLPDRAAARLRHIHRDATE
jgi:hypothetical protein